MKTLYTATKLLALSIAIFMTSFVTSCTRDTNLEANIDSGKYKLRLLFNVVQSTTKAFITENDVQRLDIMLFNNGKLEKTIRNITSFANVDGYSSVEVGFDTEGARTAYVIANIDDDQWLNTLVDGTTTISEVTAAQTANLTRMANPPLVMYGISEEINFSTTQSNVLCQLYRAVARIDVENKASNFIFKSARLISSKVASTIFPSKSILNSAVKDFDAEPANDTSSICLYSYENSVEDVDKATKVEITGTVNNTPLTYTVELKYNNNLIPIERNYLYTINILDVQENNINTTITVTPWKLGSDINQVFGGNHPVVDVTIDSEAGVYSAVDSTFAITAKGGQIIFDSKANAECEINIVGNWLSLATQTKAASYIEGRFVINAAMNLTEIVRTATISISNKISKSAKIFTLTQVAAEAQGDKYMVVVVAGQSNAVGYDQSPIDAIDLQTSPRALQLSYRKGSPNANLSLIPLTWCADDIDARKESKANESGQMGLKGIHLPLAKELLKYIPSNYKIVIIPVAYASSRFAMLSGTTFGTYDANLMRPSVMTQYMRWGTQSAYVNTILDRTKKILDMDPQNKFLGVVWCQGENDNTDSNYHYDQFTSMANYILSDLNKTYANRTHYGSIDKRSWYTYSSCQYWVDWYSAEDASAVFGGYKAWNPDNFIHIPITTPMNPQDGGAGMGKYHFGKNAYRDVIAPMVAQRMNDNGALYNGTTPKTGNHFKDNTTVAEAQIQGGNLGDADITESLLFMAPFETSVIEKKYGTMSATSYSMSLTATTGLIDINGNPRQRSALSLSSTGGYIRLRPTPTLTDWTISFMFKRTANFDANMQAIFTTMGSANAPFIGFMKFSDNMGVAKAAEFIVEPINSTIKANAVPGLFLAANKVRSLTDWIHYTITYNNSSKEFRIYMNGELVQTTKIATSTTSVLPTNLYIGNSDPNYVCADGQMVDLYIWGKTINPNVIKKVFLMSYYGFTK